MIEVAFETSVDVGEGAKSLKSLKQEFKETQKELDGLTAGSDRYVASLKKLGKIKDEIGDLNTTIKAFNPEGKVQAVTTVVGGLASGFQAATGAAALFGGESKELEKALLKVQAVMAFTEGIKGLVSMGDAFKVLGNIIKANPIGAFITIVAALGAAAVALYESLDKTSDSTKKLTKEAEKQKEVVSALVGVIQRQVDLLTAQGASEETIVATKKKLIEAQIKEVEIGILLHRSKINDIKNNDSLLESSLRIEASLLRKIGFTEQAELYEKAIVINKLQRAKEDIDAIKKAENDLLNFKNEILVLDATQQTKKREKSLKDSTEEGKLESEAYLEELKKRAEWDKAYKQAQHDQREQERLDAISTEESIRKAKADNSVALAQIEVYSTGNSLSAQLALLLEQQKQELAATELTENQKIVIKQKYAEQAKKLQRDQFNSELDSGAKLTAALQQLSDIYFQHQLNNVHGNVAKERAIKEKQFKINKAFNLAQTAIEGARAVISASSMTPYLYVGLGASIAASVATTAALAKIASTKFDDGNSGGGAGVSVPSVDFSGGGNRPPIINAPNSGNTQLNPDGTVNMPDNSAPNQNLKAYVVESEITAIQGRVGAIENNAKI